MFLPFCQCFHAILYIKKEPKNPPAAGEFFHIFVFTNPNHRGIIYEAVPMPRQTDISSGYAGRFVKTAFQLIQTSVSPTVR